MELDKNVSYNEQLLRNVEAKERLVAEGHTNIEFDPDEADLLGAFEETALSEEDALESRFDGDTGEDD